ncbi:MAG: S1C family serine protease [Pirellulaceae bacterium]
MRRTVLVCGISAAIGALLGVGGFQHGRLFPAVAQEVIRRPPAGQPAPPADLRGQLPIVPPGNGWDAGLEEFSPDERTNILVYEKTNRCVVHITTKVYAADSFFQVEPSEGAGSGSVIDQQGHILTNNHVIEDASELHVALHDGQTYDAKLVGRDVATDIAVIRVDAPPEVLFPIEFGDSSRLRVGQKVLAIGNPFGLERTLTVGTLSSLNRRIPTRQRQLRSMIQIDAALNRGNSGGPLLDSHGRLIGMNTAILSPTGQNIGVGFALPVNLIRRVVPQLIERGRVIRAISGIASVFETERGLTIMELVPGGPAEQAGLRSSIVTKRERAGFLTIERRYRDTAAADVIVAVDGQPIKTGDALQELLDTKQPGDRIVLTVVRAGRPVEVPIVLGTSD